MVESGKGLAGVLAALAAVCWPLTQAFPFGGEHHRITEVAIDAQPHQQQEYLRPERGAMVQVYCTFPDVNWPCYGRWGGGTGDPRAARMPETRRVWEVSYYCGWDPVLQKGKGYPHGPPKSWEAAGVFFRNAAAAVAAGRREDACRYLGVMLHYIEDSASMPHVQPIHRTFHVKDMRLIRLDDCRPIRLGRSAEEAAGALRTRVQKLTEWSEQRVAGLLESVGMPIEGAKRQAAQQLMAPAVVAAVARLRAEKPAEFEAAAADCANQSAQVCADAIYSALTLAAKPYVEPGPNPPQKNLVFNPSFDSGEPDAAPAGWCPWWQDMLDRAGRAEWYRAGMHWEKHVRTGPRSLLILWPPKQGLAWQQTWPKAIRVRPGETYRGSIWAQGSGAAGPSSMALEFSDTDYRPLLTVRSDALAADGDWHRLAVEARVPEKARWMRMILHAEGGQGATWFDDAEVMRR